MNFAGKFVPNYKRLVKPLVSLLSEKGGNRWLAEHTRALNNIMEVVYKHIKLGLVNPRVPLRIHVDTAGVDCSAVLT